MRLYITYDDAIMMTLGTAAEGLVSYGVRSATKSPTTGKSAYPNMATTALLGGGSLIAAYSGLITRSPEEYPKERAIAAFLLGFGISQVISYILPRISGGETDAVATVTTL